MPPKRGRGGFNGVLPLFFGGRQAFGQGDSCNHCAPAGRNYLQSQQRGLRAVRLEKRKNPRLSTMAQRWETLSQA
jgi:hypothetical protein